MHVNYIYNLFLCNQYTTMDPNNPNPELYQYEGAGTFSDVGEGVGKVAVAVGNTADNIIAAKHGSHAGEISHTDGSGFKLSSDGLKVKNDFVSLKRGEFKIYKKGWIVIGIVIVAILLLAVVLPTLLKKSEYMSNNSIAAKVKANAKKLKRMLK